MGHSRCVLDINPNVELVSTNNRTDQEEEESYEGYELINTTTQSVAGRSGLPITREHKSKSLWTK